MRSTVESEPASGNTLGGSARRGAWGFFLVALCALLPFAATRDFEHVHDDHELRGPASLAVDPRASLADLWTADVFGTYEQPRGESGYWRPLVLLSFRLEAHLSGVLRGDGSWAGYLWLGHVGTVLCHLAACLALLALLRALALSDAAALLASALFAVHPVHVESVAWASGRTESLPVALVFGGAAVWLRGARGGAILAFLAMLAALLCKESAVVLVVLAGLLAWVHGLRGRRLMLPAAGALIAALLLRAAAFGLVRQIDPTAITGPPEFSARLFTWLSVLPDLLELALWPGAPTPIHPVVAATSIIDPGVLAGLALLLAFVVATLAALRSRRPLDLLICALPAGTFLGLAPWVTIPLGFPEVAGPLADRYAYALVAAPCVLLALLLARPLARAGHFAPLVWIVPVILVGRATAARCEIWRDDVAFARAGLQTAPGSPSLWNHLGVALLEHLRVAGDEAAGEAALEAFRRTLELQPSHALAQLNRFIVLALLDREDEARPIAARLLRDRPQDPQVLDNVAAWHARAARWEDAIALYERELATGAASPLARDALSAARAALERERSGR